jgi:hypothetical protein
VPGITSQYGVVALDTWGAPGTEFRVGGIDKLDVSTLGGDALVQFQVGAGWEPADGLPLARGLFRSIPGLTLLYPPNGPTGVRFRRRVAGVASSINFDAFQL